MKFIQKITLLSLCFAFVPSAVNADPLKYKIEGETVTVVDCDESASGELVIPSVYDGIPVTAIEQKAFLECSSLTSVTIPDSVTSIGMQAFVFCSSLTKITIPDSVTSIGNSAFMRCSSLTSVTIGNSVTSIGGGAFMRCSSLTSVTIGNSVTSIGNNAFFECSSLTSLTIGNSVVSIGNSAFSFCSSLTSVTIPDSVNSIGTLAFSDCSNLTSVSIPDSITSIGGGEFINCSSLKNIIFEGNAPSIRKPGIIGSNAKIFIKPGATGFGETFGGLPVQILKKKLDITSFNSHAAPFSLSFETESDSTYKIEASHDLMKWGEIGEVQGTGSSVKFIERRKALFPKQYYRVKLVE